MSLLEELRGGLIVSVQAEPASLLNAPATIALLARVAVANGARGVRIEGLERIAAVRAAVEVPIVGLIKRVRPGFEPYISATLEEVRAIAAAGADIVAFDATLRSRADGSSPADLAAGVRAAGRLAMADCSTEGEMLAAAGVADVLATTLAGYTPETRGRALPALDLVAAVWGRHRFVACEGGIATPEHARAAFGAGASAIVVGTAITNLDALVRRFAGALQAS
ncbi:MAG: putative N-acetylmannosamine-6-phosphate 2-epimerase [Candidatus Baltobacteraceae bacterium]